MVRRRIVSIAANAFLVIVALLAVSPIVITIARSLGGMRDGLYIGFDFTAYIDFFVWEPEYLYALTNSVIIAGATSLGMIAVSIPAGFVFAKVSFPGRDILFYLYIIIMIMPFQVTMLPQYMLSRELGIYDTLFAVILPGMFMPFAAFLLTQTIKSVSDEVLEAASLETSSTLIIIIRILMPAIRPAILCAWVISFCEAWNAVSEPLVFLETREKYPLAVMLHSIAADNVLGFAAATVFLLLPLLVFTIFEDEVIEGLGEYNLK